MGAEELSPPPTAGGVVLITGAATGVGRGCAVRFARHGFDVVVNHFGTENDARRTAALVESAGARALVVECDVSDDAKVRDMVSRVEREFGRLDALVNSAGTTAFIQHQRLEELSEVIWDRILDVNLKGPYFVTRAAVPLLRQSPRASVVNVSSAAAITGQGSSIAYCASKGALNTMTKSLARALAPQIRVNAVCPGPISTDWMRGVLSEEEIEGLAAGYPIPRVATADDVADAVFYLTALTSLTTGQCLVIDGGATI
ncbi:SDR family NAD(P)-dependent oxidoreductase [Streptomyces blattellae]|uniref:SDR family NAD(P)-dependent oxidoreductase n=1 Tax=Streptomyces blattellae TaxID=2569855 RepID=UPI0012B86BC2|nr:SDR family oxidoreductase [Streptomyces blattellae]